MLQTDTSQSLHVLKSDGARSHNCSTLLFMNVSWIPLHSPLHSTHCCRAPAGQQMNTPCRNHMESQEVHPHLSPTPFHTISSPTTHTPLHIYHSHLPLTYHPHHPLAHQPHLLTTHIHPFPPSVLQVPSSLPHTFPSHSSGLLPSPSTSTFPLALTPFPSPHDSHMHSLPPSPPLEPRQPLRVHLIQFSIDRQAELTPLPFIAATTFSLHRGSKTPVAPAEDTRHRS